MNTDSELLTLDEVAEKLRCSKKTVRRLIAQGRLIAYKITPKNIVITQEELNQFMNNVPTHGGFAA